MARKKQVRQNTFKKYQIKYDKVRWNSSIRLPDEPVYRAIYSVSKRISALDYGVELLQ